MHSEGGKRDELIRPIQYLRGLAALMVVWYHTQSQLAGYSFFSKAGMSGVDLFFVISGFIMVVTTADKNITTAEFLRRRVIRVVPLYWLITLLVVALALAAPSAMRSTHVSLSHVVQSLLFIPHPSPSHPGTAWPILVPGWTLNFEMFFYLVFAASLMLTRPLVLLIVCFLTLISIGSFFGPFQNAIATTYTSPIQMEFVIGAVLGQCWVSRRLRMPFAVGAALVSMGAVMLLLRTEAHRLAYLIQVAGAAMVVAGSLQERFLRWNNRPLQALGDASYSIYLTHLVALGGLRWAWAKFGPPLTPALSLVFLAMGLALSCAVGWFVYRRIERPMTRWLNTKLASSRRPVLAAA